MKSWLLAILITALSITTHVAYAKSKTRYEAALVSDYLFRGITQTEHNLAAQAGAKLQNNNAYAGVWASNIKVPKKSEGIPVQMNVYFGYNNRFTKNFNIDVSVITYNYLTDSRGDDTEFKFTTSPIRHLDISLYRGIKSKMWYPEVRYEYFFPYRIYADFSAGIWLPDKAKDKALHARAEVARDFPELSHIDLFIALDAITDMTPFGDENDKDKSETSFLFGIRKRF